LDGIDGLLNTAAPLAGCLKSRRLAMETAAIQAIARKLAARLGRRDPLAGRVRLGRMGYVSCMLVGIGKGLTR
jgi:ABC-type Zn2+ transport system substrate-binding protein/surface adhesin